MCLSIPTAGRECCLPMNQVRNHSLVRNRFNWFILLAWLALSCLSAGCSRDADTRVAAPNVTFHTLTGEQLALQDIDAPLLVNFWATSCVICVAEMPELIALHDRLAPEGVRFVAVAMPYDPPNQVLEYSEAADLPFAVALDIDGRVLAAFEPIPGTPTRVLVDASGAVVERQIGRADVPELERLLRGLLLEPVGAPGT